MAQAPAASRLFTPSELKADLSFLLTTLENIHPSLYHHRTREAVKSDLDSVRSAITEPLSRLEFARRIIPAFTKLNDGHTAVYFPQEERSAFLFGGGKVFPFEVLVREDRIFITRNHSHDTTIALPSEIKTLNGLAAPALLSRLRQYVSAELPHYRNIRLQSSFRSLLWYVIGPDSVFRMELEASGRLADKTVTGITSTEFQQAAAGSSTGPSPYMLKFPAADLAVLDFRSMQNRKAFEAFLDSSFRVIRNRGVRTLAVDIRNNGGGNSQLGDALLDYIADTPYKQIDRMEVKASKEMKKYFRQRYLKWYFYPLVPFSVFSRQARHYLFGRPGTIQVITDRKPRKPGTPPYKFDGETFVLISNYTFSSANMLANAIACYDLGTIVGEETGGVLRAFGDVIPIQLPNTGLRAGCSFKRFLHPCDDGRAHGVVPDVPITPTAEDMLRGRDRALEYVKARAAGRTK
jgi:hypothetical protein